MKKRYEKPILEVDAYELDTSIASNCRYVVKMGPEYGDHKLCEDYLEYEPFSVPGQVSPMAYNVDFWENCDCYTGASGQYFTS